MDIAEFVYDPYKFSLYAWAWGAGDLAASKGPRQWQSEILKDIGAHFRNPATRYTPYLLAVASGNAIGKTALEAIVINWAMSTCVDCRCVVTAINETQLRTKLWPELKLWHSRAINASWFNAGATSLQSDDEKHAAFWRADWATWNENTVEGFQGLHNFGKRIVVIFDEASGIPDNVWNAAYGPAADAGTEFIWLAFSNPVRTDGAFYQCWEDARWKTRNIDSRTVEGTNVDFLNQRVEKEGEDSDTVRMYVRGLFPRASYNQFISGDTVRACKEYKAEGYQALPKILGVDVARYGQDNTVIILRQGRYSKILFRKNGLSTVETEQKVIDFIRSEKADAVTVDGDGVGASVCDLLDAHGYGKLLHRFRGKHTALSPAMYANRRAEIWGKLRDWLHEGAQLPDDDRLAKDLSECSYKSDEKGIQLLSKDRMRAHGLDSPDAADALAMTFAVTVAPKRKLAAEHFQPNLGRYAWMG